MSTSEAVQRAGLRVHQWLYERTDGRIGGKVGNLPALLLRTTGAKTGKTRTSALVYGTDGDGRYVVVASDGGADRSPGWVHNLRADPHAEIQVGRERHAVTAQILTEGPDYDRGWKIMNDLNRVEGGGRYEHYQTLTARKIPVVVLST